MTTQTDIANRALISVGIPKRITSLSQDSVEAQAANSVITKVRDELLRMAPWNCGTFFDNLTYITSAPGTPENLSPGFTTWRRGIPAPPWAYEYQYPVDCLKPLWVVPQYSTGFSGGIPITTAVTGGVASFWSGPPVRYKVATDNFFPVIFVTVASGGTGHAIGDVITLPYGPITSPPIGAPAKLLVNSVAGGVITSAGVISVIPDTPANAPIGGSYFSAQTNPIPQASTTGAGIGATFNLTFQQTSISQRVILTNEEFAILAYVKQITDPNVMDEQFIQAWTSALGARITFVLNGDRALANMKLQETNNYIMEARKSDANEGLTINNVTPDWIRHRGIAYPLDFGWAPNQTFDWGPVFSMY